MRAIQSGLLAAFLLVPALAHGWWNDSWSFRKQVDIDTTPAAGSEVPAALSNFPVLIRLHAGNFGYFSDLRENGADLRFVAGDDKTPLKYHIERFDAVNQMALVWVNLPELAPSSNQQHIWMYYGNSEAVDGGDAAGTYDVNQALVYHFTQTTGAPQDITAYANNASQSTAEISNTGLIGGSIKFAGSNTILIPAKPAIRFSPASGWTLSAWLKIDSPQQAAVIMQTEEAGKQFIVAVDGLGLYARYQGDSQIETPKSQLTQGKWQHIAVTAGKGQLALYVNGMAVGSIAAAMQDIQGEIVIGGLKNGTSGLVGEIDELQISNAMRSAEWLKLAASSQGTEARLLSYGGDEKQDSTSSESYFGTILQNVTLDGWVVIILLALMAAISWLVMFGKAIYISRVRKDNRAFLKAFKENTGDPSKLDHEPDAEERQLENSPLAEALLGKHDHFQSSSLYRLYHHGIQDMQHRLGRAVGAQATALSPNAINSMRAGLDAALIRETQRLGSQMVLLTIAISGGPFLGLLGTVVGVMITFAAIAASGEVNVNAIAPGIAAALVATVAGLAVAIPALFGYNYLSSRIKEINADMHVFVDEFVTRLAEYYGN